MNIIKAFKALQYFQANGLEINTYWEDSFTLIHARSGTKSPIFYSETAAMFWSQGFVAGYSAKGK